MIGADEHEQEQFKMADGGEKMRGMDKCNLPWLCKLGRRLTFQYQKPM